MEHVRVHVSALKRGASAREVIRMWLEGREEALIDDDEPARYIRLAFDGAGLPWEVVALIFGNGARVLVIHAMPARKSVIEQIQGRKQ